MSLRTDITIIGAGVVGLAIASQVARKGREVYMKCETPVKLEVSKVKILIAGCGAQGNCSEKEVIRLQ
jgi:3-hydroxyacyl-CoA dehydrogenase